MSVSRCFSIIGDSNVRRNISKNSCKANPLLKSTQVVLCGSIELFSESLSQVRAESNVCVVACLSNFISDSAAVPVSLSQRVTPVLHDIHEKVTQACEQNPDRMYLLLPPMFRSSPVWYREGLPEILSLFSQQMFEDKPSNLGILPSFTTPEYVSDGVHLNPTSGFEYVLHLLDASETYITELNSELDCSARNVRVSEASRLLEDRVVVLEQDHRRLDRFVEKKTAVDYELADFLANERLEDFFVISGLPRIPPTLVSKAWQERAVKDVQRVILSMMGREMSIVVVQNITSRVPDSEVTYNVKMSEVSDSRAIRKKFGSYFLGGSDKRPQDLRSISIKNRVTPDTKIRISLLKLMAKRYRDSNPGSRVQVIGYEPRPLIKITPAPTASDRRVKVFNFVEAVRQLPTVFSEAELTPIVRRISPKTFGQVRATFVVLSDDMIKRRPPPADAQDDSEVNGVQDEVVAPVQSGSSRPWKRKPSPGSGSGAPAKK